MLTKESSTFLWWKWLILEVKIGDLNEYEQKSYLKLDDWVDFKYVFPY